MEKEQIVKALECCADNKPCERCPLCGLFYTDEACKRKAMHNALSLIREQEKRIEGLTLENAGLYAGAKVAAKFVRADTVRKMVESLKEKAIDVDTDDDTLWVECVTVADIDRIAEEMLEGGDSDDTV